MSRESSDECCDCCPVLDPESPRRDERAIRGTACQVAPDARQRISVYYPHLLDGGGVDPLPLAGSQPRNQAERGCRLIVSEGPSCALGSSLGLSHSPLRNPAASLPSI
jgi:hypothetical protein